MKGKRIGIAMLTALALCAVIAATAWAAYSWSSYTGPAIVHNNGNGTWNVRWTITVTALGTGNDNYVCVTTSTGQSGLCGSTTGTLTCNALNVPNAVPVTWQINSYRFSDCTTLRTLGPSGTISPLAVDLATLTVDASGDGVTLAWETVSEQDSVGFNVYRAHDEAGPWLQVNAALIPAAAPGSAQGQAYAWTDAAVAPGATYWYTLEDVALDGTRTRQAPVAVTVTGPNAVGLAGFAAAAGPAAAIPAALALLGLVGTGALARLGRHR